MTDAPKIARPDDIDATLATRAFSGTSFDPEKRGASRREEYALDVNGFYAELWPMAKTDHQKELLAFEMEGYRQGFIRHLNAFLHSHSSVVSSMIAGPSNFPVARMQKRGQWADKRATELVEWREKARRSIKGKLLDARPEEEKASDAWTALERELNDSLSEIEAIDAGKSAYTRSNFTNSISGRIERLAQAGEVELVTKATALLARYCGDHEKPCFTAKHKVWGFLDVAREAEERNKARAGKPQELLAEENGIELWANYALDRAQLVFPAKPGHEQRETLKRSGWKWSPTNEAWQRQLTDAAIHAGKQFLAGQKVEPERDSPGR